MDLNKKLLALLAIFCVIVSASAVCAADNDGYAGSNYQDTNGVSDVGNGTAIDGNQDALEPGAGLPLENQTNNVTANTTDNATGNTTGNATNNVTANATSNSTNATSIQNMLATGNPIIALLAVGAIAGGYAVIRRNK